MDGLRSGEWTPAEEIKAMDRLESMSPRPSVIDTPIPTGNIFLDEAGKQGTYGFQGERYDMPGYTRPELVAESPEGRKRDASRRGIDFRKGAPFSARLAQAVTISTPTQKAEMLHLAMGEQAAALPDGLPLLVWDENLGALTYYRQITKDDIEDACIRENTQRFSQSANTPFMQPPLVNDFGYLAETEAAE